jgi:hypothetical protein
MPLCSPYLQQNRRADHPCSEMLAPLVEELLHAARRRVDEHTVAGTNRTVFAYKIFRRHGLEEESRLQC